MSRLPLPGEQNWGAILNDFLRVAHREDGELGGVPPVINARDFGAKGDDSTNDTAALQQAVQAAAGGRTLFIPTGIYLTCKLILPSNITICGEGNGSVLKLLAGTFDALLTNEDWKYGNSHIVLRSMRLDGNRDANVQPEESFFPDGSGQRDKSHAVNFHAVQDSLIEDLTVVDFYYDGIYLGSSVPNHYADGETDLSNGSDRNVVRHNQVIGNGRNGITITRGTDNLVIGNLLQNNGVGAPDDGTENKFTAGAIDIEPPNSAPWYDVSRNMIQNNHVLGSRYNGIQVMGWWTCSGLLLSSNIVSGSARHGIHVQLCSELIAQGNHVTANRATGMTFSNVKGAVVSANIANANYGTGIAVNGAQGEQIVLMGNIAVGNGPDDAGASGIIWVDSQMVTLVGNVCLDNASVPRPQLLANGADPIYFANRVGPLGIPAASRIVRDNDQFASYWRMYATETNVYVENQRTNKIFMLPLDPAP